MWSGCRDAEAVWLGSRDRRFGDFGLRTRCLTTQGNLQNKVAVGPEDSSPIFSGLPVLELDSRLESPSIVETSGESWKNGGAKLGKKVRKYGKIPLQKIISGDQIDGPSWSSLALL